jgi:NAD(P)-dependent dehydrogenase (short-subunit alcohol dehydrogenase family)
MMLDPKPQGPRPDYPQRAIEPPGQEAELTPQADHGEQSYRGSGRLDGQVALITGADSGIGRAVAIAFAREGANIVISYLNEDADARETERWVREAGRQALVVKGDLTDESACVQLVERTLQTFGRLDILVNNAAFQRSHDTIEEISSEEFDRTWRTNVYAMFWLCRAALPRMKDGSVILNTSSIQAYQPSPTLLAYAATKAAIANFTKALSQMAMQRSIRVNAIAPGPVWTPLIPSTLPNDRVRTFGSDTVFERAAQPAEIAPVYVFLASNDARYVSGEVYGVTGGKMPL